ncbi:MAG: ABC transporter permease [Bacillota bacterium]
MNLTTVFAVVGRIIRQFFRDRRTLAMIIVVPMVVLSLLVWILRSPLATPEVAVVSPDAEVTRLATAALTEGGQLQVVELDTTDYRQALRDAKVKAVYIIPGDVLTAMAAGRAADLTVAVQGTNPTMTRLAEAMTGKVAQALAPAVPHPVPVPFVPQKPVVHTEYVYGSPDFTSIDIMAPAFIAFFAFFFVFLLTSVSFLRERTQGTMVRLFASPMRPAEMVLGYTIGFTLFALVQSAIVLLFVISALKIHYVGSVAAVFLIEAVLTIGSVNLGIFLSTYAKNELQVVQFIPLVIVPQVILSGFLFPLEDMTPALRFLGQLMPLTYANRAMKDIMVKGMGLADVWPSLAVLGGFVVFFTILGSVAARRSA